MREPATEWRPLAVPVGDAGALRASTATQDGLPSSNV